MQDDYPEGHRRPSAERKARLRREYAALYNEIAAILFRHDPMGISMGLNRDEYDPEVSTILPHLIRVTTPEEVREIIHQEFASWFSPELARDPLRFESIARDVYAAVKRHLPRGFEK